MTDVVAIIKDYNAWVLSKELEENPTGPDAYAKVIETEKELRILKAVRADIDAVFDGTQDFDLEFVLRLLAGDETALKETEASYEN